MATFKLDSVHSGIAFQIKHLMVAKVKGEFKQSDVQLEGDLNSLETLKIDVTVDASSIDTNNGDRDAHLRSADFFEVDKYPSIKVVGESIKKVSEGEYELVANVTIKDVTNKEKFLVEYNGTS